MHSIDFKNGFLEEFIKFIENCFIDKINNIDIFYELETYITAYSIICIILVLGKIVANVIFIIIIYERNKYLC